VKKKGRGGATLCRFDPLRRPETSRSYCWLNAAAREMNAVLRCDCHTTGAHLRGSLETGFDAIYVGDDPLEDWDDPRFWFQVDADRNPPSSHPIAGLGLALGTNKEGAGCDVGIRLEEAARCARASSPSCCG
jgi:hypothetical protein